MAFLQPQFGDVDYVDNDGGQGQAQLQTQLQGGQLANGRYHGRKADGTPVAFPDDKQQLYQHMVRQLVFDGHADVAEALMQSTGVVVPKVHDEGNKLQQLVSMGEASVSSRKEAINTEAGRHVVEHLLDQSVYLDEGTNPLVTPTLRERYVTDGLASTQRSSCWSADGQFIAVGGANGIVRVFSIPAMAQASKLTSKPVTTLGEPSAFETNWSLAREFNDNNNAVEWLKFMPTEKTKICTGGVDGKLFLRDIASPDCTQTELKLGGKPFLDTYPIRCGAFHPGGGYLLYGTDHDAVRLYDMEAGEVFSAGGVSTIRHTAAVADVAFSPDGSTFASCSYDGALNLYETSSGRGTFQNAKAHSAVPVTSCHFSRSGNIILTGGMDSQARLWDLRKMNVEVACFCPHAKTGHRIKAFFDYSEKRIIMSSPSSGLGGAGGAAKKGGDDKIGGEGGSGKAAAGGAGSSSNDKDAIKTIRVIDIFTGQVTAGLMHQQEQKTFAVSPTELMIATCGDDSRMRIWGTSL